MTALFLFFCSLSWADAPAPYYPRDFNSNNPMGAYNQNLSDITNRNRDNLVPIVKDNSCADSEVLFGPTQKGGFLFGGRCASPATASGSTVSVTSPLSGDGSSGSPVALTGAVPIAQISLATVTTALAGKLSNTAAVPAALLDFSTITTALATKLSTFTVSRAASLYGDGTSIAILGVQSSSVAVKNGSGFVQNAEIDPSTVPKLNSSGKIPNSYMIGLTSTCASGFVLTTGTYSNGLLVGGWCEAQSGSGGSSATGTAPTRQVFLSGSGTYTSPANVTQIKVLMVGGGGGGGGCSANSGVRGASSYFGVFTATGGAPGNPDVTTSPGAGGTGGAGSASLRIAGGGGFPGSAAAGFYTGGDGGNSAFGGGAPGVNNSGGLSGAANSGGGGSGGSATSTCWGSGGGAGEYVELIINSPSASYPYVVGAGGAGGAAGTNAGGSGGAGVVVVDEYYAIVAPVSGTLGFVVDNFLGQVNGSKTAYTLSQVPASSSTLMVVLDGLLQSGASDYTYSAGIVTMTTAPASNSSSFYVQYAVNTSTFVPVVGNFTAAATTAAYASIQKGGGWTLLASTHPIAATAVQFYNLVSTNPIGGGVVQYKVEINLTQNTSAGILEARFNDDSGAGLHGYVNVGASAAGDLRNTYTTNTFCILSYVSGGIGVGLQHRETYRFAPHPTPVSNSGIRGDWTESSFNSGTTKAYIAGVCDYLGTNPISNLKIFTDAGTFTGDFSLWGMFLP